VTTKFAWPDFRQPLCSSETLTLYTNDIWNSLQAEHK